MWGLLASVIGRVLDTVLALLTAWRVGRGCSGEVEDAKVIRDKLAVDPAYAQRMRDKWLGTGRVLPNLPTAGPVELPDGVQSKRDIE